MVYAVKKLYNQNGALENSNLASFIASEKSLTSILDFGQAKGLETNNESAPYTKIEIKLHKTLHSFPAEWSISKFAIGSLNC